MRSIARIARDRGWKNVAIDVVVAVASIAVAAVALPVVTHTTFTVGPITMSAHARPAVTGVTAVDVPPFGEVSARTHVGPLSLRARIERIDTRLASRTLQQSMASSGPADLLQRSTDGLDVRARLWRPAALGILGSIAIAASVAWALRRTARVMLVTGLAAGLLCATSMGVAAATWNAQAFSEPRLTGALTYLPRLGEVFTERVSRIQALQVEAAKVAESLASYYRGDRGFAITGELPDTYRVLHVTDLHLDSVGAQLGASIARAYDVSLIIDTGDTPILGTPIEGVALRSLFTTAAPRVYVPGNHDSPASVAAISELPSVTVLSSGTVEIDGLRIFGVADPISRTFGVEPDTAELERVTRIAASGLLGRVRSGEPTPDIVAIHNPGMESPFVGRVELVLSGHTHRAQFRTTGGTVRLNSGTLGGMPYAPSATRRKRVPHSASILYYTKSLPRRLLAVDTIEVHTDRTTTISRHVVSE